MLKIITGKPGSGKSYYAVKQIIDNCKYDPIHESYNTNEGLLLVASLEGLRLNFVDFDQTIKDMGAGDTDLKKFPGENDDQYQTRNGLYSFFSVPLWQNEIAPKYQKILVVIDEAQRYFPGSARDIPNSVWYWFEYHRHFGADIILMTQHPSSLHRRVLNIAENYIEASPPGLRQMQNLLRYSLRDTTTNEIISQSSQRTDTQVFKAYKSATHAQGIKAPPNYLTKFYYIGGAMAVSVLVGIVVFFNYLMDAFNGDKPKKETPVATSKPFDQVKPQNLKTSEKNGSEKRDIPEQFDFEPVIPGKPETAPAYKGLLKVQNVPVLAGCIKSANACKCYTAQATPYPVTYEQCLEHVANLKFNPYASAVIRTPEPSQPPQTAPVVMNDGKTG